MSDTLINIDEKIERLKKRREKVQTLQAIYFMRETQKIFQDSFKPNMALHILSETWNAASDTQKQRWMKLVSTDKQGRSHPFRPATPQNNRKKSPAPEPTYQQD